MFNGLGTGNQREFGSTMAKLKNIYEERHKNKKKILNEIYRKASIKILETEKYKLNHCTFNVPTKLPNYDFTDVNIEELTKWLMNKLIEEGFQVYSLNGIVIDTEVYEHKKIGSINDIMIIWNIPEKNMFESKIKIGV